MVKVKPPEKVCLHSFVWFCLQINGKNYFPSLVQDIGIENY